MNMKVDPNIPGVRQMPIRPDAQISEVRRAFEAMLSAGSARTPQVQPQSIWKEPASDAPQPVMTKEAEATFLPLARPGRVLDIKV
jgi:hypothetical protein